MNNPQILLPAKMDLGYIHSEFKYYDECNLIDTARLNIIFSIVNLSRYLALKHRTMIEWQIKYPCGPDRKKCNFWSIIISVINYVILLWNCTSKDNNERERSILIASYNRQVKYRKMIFVKPTKIWFISIWNGLPF